MTQKVKNKNTLKGEIMKKARLIIAALSMLLVLLIPTVAFAMEPVDTGFDIKNIGKKPITVNISTEGYSEDIRIAGESSVHVDYSFDEPDTYDYTIRNKDAAAGDKSYVVRFFVETDETEALTVYVVPWIEGTKEKPAEVVFGTPEYPQTGDHTSKASLYVGGCVCSFGIAAVCLIYFLLRKHEKNSDASDK